MADDLELRCPGRMHGIIIDGKWLEVYCNSRNCGAVPGVAVLHRYDIGTGDLIGTKKYQVPPRAAKRRKE